MQLCDAVSHSALDLRDLQLKEVEGSLVDVSGIQCGGRSGNNIKRGKNTSLDQDAHL